ncbi:hypothetical protein LTR86_000903 [Recurvomyces mirabilis]|nr:hypothetical protein LTR86_000903 [Recurvomyces mirabilis]
MNIGLAFAFLQSCAAQYFTSFAIPNTPGAQDNVLTFGWVYTTPSQPPSSSSFSYTRGPYASAYSYTWRYMTPSTVGTVLITVNIAKNETISSTVFHTNFRESGNQTILTRTDVNDANTVTGVVGNFTVTYPTPVFDIATDFTWLAVQPQTGTWGTCCMNTTLHSITPLHTSFRPTGTTDSRDPRGWLYSLTGYNLQGSADPLGPQDLTSLWGGGNLTIPYAACLHTWCGVGYAPDEGSRLGFVTAVPNILATSITTISSAGMGSSTAAPGSAAAASPLPNPTMSTIMITSSSTSRSINSGSPGFPEISLASTTSVASAAGDSSGTTSTLLLTTINSAASQIQQKTSSNQELSSMTALPLVASPSSLSSAGMAAPAAATTITTAKVTGGGLAAPALSILLSAETPATPKPHTESQSIVGTQSVTAGAQAITIIGTIISAASPATETIIGSSTILPTQINQSANPLPTLKVGSSTITANSKSQYMIAGQTLQPGGPAITLSATPISLATSATELVVGSSTIPLSPPPARTTVPDITLGSSVLTPDSDSVYVLGSQTLSPGGSAITVSGTRYSLVADSGELLVGSNTEVVTTTGTGMYIWSNIGASSITGDTQVSPASTTINPTSHASSGVPTSARNSESTSAAGMIASSAAFVLSSMLSVLSSCFAVLVMGLFAP